MEYEKIEHTFEPVYDEYSEILILGTFPSVKSRENNFYYGHPQNRFWKVIANINNVPVPESIDEKRKLLLDLHIAIWDVVASCSISGSSDSSIKDVTATIYQSFLKIRISKLFMAMAQRPVNCITDMCIPKLGARL